MPNLINAIIVGTPITYFKQISNDVFCDYGRSIRENWEYFYLVADIVLMEDTIQWTIQPLLKRIPMLSENLSLIIQGVIWVMPIMKKL